MFNVIVINEYFCVMRDKQKIKKQTKKLFINFVGFTNVKIMKIWIDFGIIRWIVIIESWLNGVWDCFIFVQWNEIDRTIM